MRVNSSHNEVAELTAEELSAVSGGETTPPPSPLGSAAPAAQAAAFAPDIESSPAPTPGPLPTN